MAEQRGYLDHLFVIGFSDTKTYAPQGGGGQPKIRAVDRFHHGTQMMTETREAFEDADLRRERLSHLDDELQATGVVIVLEGEGTAFPLQLERLTRRPGRGTSPKPPQWLLLSVQPKTEGRPERATVWVSDEHRHTFLKLFQDFLEKDTQSGNPRNRELVANMARIRTAFLLDLWTSEGAPPVHGKQWWQLWLDPTDTAMSSVTSFTEVFGLQISDRTLRLPDRLVVWVEATWNELLPILSTVVPLTEIRRHDFIDTIEDLSRMGQQEYVIDLAERVIAPDPSAPAVCLLDTGALRSHVLLRDALSPRDHQAIKGKSGNDSHLHGHGTSMAGLALFGPHLEEQFTSTEQIELAHRLESVRMWPGRGQPEHTKIDHGTATTEAVALPEITHFRPRVFCLTLSSAPDGLPGEPTLWSAAIDAMAVGTDSARVGDEFQLISDPDPGNSRLFVIAAGNIDPADYRQDYRVASELAPIEDPAQAWNALTVGASTELVESPSHPEYTGWSPLAGHGELSPHSRTSVRFDHTKWPLKPDICMEGGNILSDGTDVNERHPLLSLRSCGNASDTALTSANATSAAAAQAARLAAIAMRRYPDYWPETIRGLLPHCAEWTPSMKREIDTARRGSKHEIEVLLRTFGWGVPTEDAVLNSSRQAVTLVTQDQFTPFEGTEFSMRSLRLHDLPWPAEALEALGEKDVRLRVTLSYFIEPSASRRGWQRRHSYASHGLRFDLQDSTETQQQFIARVSNTAQREEEGKTPGKDASKRWTLGPRRQGLGSLHQDDWYGTGAELSRCNSLAVFPVGGWWKYNRRTDREGQPVRYALLLSLQTKEEGVDLYTPIATRLQLPVPTMIDTP
ncbi:S8 family peptidase [Corynebacterium glyciniphilum]|uniref:S8 family peptidase n=1 Tax=Corynebacterium glyciniphilum TaxID=1404244 RepID=UPI00265678A3|nr:S8 family peptidase [Corynebacterium glyciniphilum]MDN5683103.1 S8 family peptidase [Corynebacterium glyciniphilum]MDN6706978.1 S8 family peptidase [Corynebacterium glyciniphilum]